MKFRKSIESMSMVFTKIRCRIDARQINLGRDIIEFFLHHLANVDITQSLSGSPQQPANLGQEQCARMSVTHPMVGGQRDDSMPDRCSLIARAGLCPRVGQRLHTRAMSFRRRLCL
jgi:hypothetical protein